MAKFIELHNEKNQSLFVNIEDVSIIINQSNRNYSVTEVVMRDDSKLKVLETKEEIRVMLNCVC